MKNLKHKALSLACAMTLLFSLGSNQSLAASVKSSEVQQINVVEDIPVDTAGLQVDVSIGSDGLPTIQAPNEVKGATNIAYLTIFFTTSPALILVLILVINHNKKKKAQNNENITSEDVSSQEAPTSI